MSATGGFGSTSRSGKAKAAAPKAAGSTAAGSTAAGSTASESDTAAARPGVTHPGAAQPDGRGRVDGRTARAERTRKSIVEAHLALIGEGDLKPTGERIAERAGVSLRTLWANFKDMETLFGATNERLMQLQDAEYKPVSPALPLPKRVEEFCRQRARMLEILAPSARAARIREPFSPQLMRNRALHIRRERKEIEVVFGPELDSAGPAREQLIRALIVSTMFASWSMLRDDLGLGVDEARAVMSRTVTSLLVAAIAAGNT